MRAAAIAVGLVLLGISAPGRAQDEPRGAGDVALPDLAARAKPCVARITIFDRSHHKVGTGSGFVVSADGRIVTNHHVIEGAEDASATFADGRELPVVGVLGEDEARDIAVLKVDASDLPVLPLGDSASLKVGDEVVVIGSPLGLSAALSTGVVAAIRDKGALEDSALDDERDARHVLGWGLQITAAIAPGSSGSPIMNRRGEVVGVAVGIMGRGSGINFGVPVRVVKATLDAVPANAEPRRFRPEVSRGLVISAAVVAALALAFGGWTWAERRAARRKGAPARKR